MEECHVKVRFVAEVIRLCPKTKGSLSLVRKPCIPPNCRASARGDKHPSWIFSFYDKGKQRGIDQLEEEVRRLKERLRYQNRKATEGFFGSSTPSSKIPVKPNTLAERQAKRGGARRGHVGYGREVKDLEE